MYGVHTRMNTLLRAPPQLLGWKSDSRNPSYPFKSFALFDRRWLYVRLVYKTQPWIEVGGELRNRHPQELQQLEQTDLRVHCRLAESLRVNAMRSFRSQLLSYLPYRGIAAVAMTRYL